MKILRYTEEVQKQIGSKTKPEPWLHVVICDDTPPVYAIYVWDTRQVVEQDSTAVAPARVNGTSAMDDCTMLKGNKNFTIHQDMNKRYFEKRRKRK